MTPSTILIVEDDRIVARDIQQQLTRIGHIVAGITARGEEVLPLSIRLQPDLVLMDIRLEGDVDGIDAAQQIRDTCNIPVIYLTAYADDETLQRAGVTEPFGYLLKPFEDSQLRTAIEMALYKYAAERRLRESERRYAVTLSSIGDAVIATDEKGQVTFMNPIAEALTGWSRADAVGMPLVEVFRIINEDTRHTVDSPAANVLRSGVVVGLANHTILVARDGRETPIDDCGAPIIDDRGAIIGTVLIFRDITQRRQTEAALRQAHAELERVARVTTLGELTAAITHEVNQPVSGLVNSGRACLNWLADDTPNLEAARRSVEHMIRAGSRVGDIISRIRMLVEKSAPQREQLNINDVITAVITLIGGEIRRNRISLHTNLSNNVPLLFGDPIQLQQVTLNLILNAIEAMSDTTPPLRELSISTRKDGLNAVRVIIRDSGVGLDAILLDQLFEAFYTTKDHGMGMGLAISRRIIQAHGGALWATPNVPQGAVFQFTMPAAGE